MARLGRVRKVARGVVAVLMVPALLVVGRWWTGNVGVVVPAGVYRSAQLSPRGLGREVRRHGIRTVLNLRGSNPDEGWYRDERDAALAAGAALIDLPIASDQWLSRVQARTLIQVLQSCERPVLIHCEWGAERTGLASAFVELLRPGGSLASARAQFSAYYLFAPWKDGLVMRGHLDRYEGWLRREGLAHSPGRFRRWVEAAYTPGRPSRQYWECNPYPLKVVTSRGPGGSARVVESWPEDRCPPKVAGRAGRETTQK